MEDILLKNIDKLKYQLEQYYTERSECSIETRGSYDIRIKRLQDELKLTEIELTKYKSAVTPDEIKIFCFVISTIFNEIKENVNTDLFCFIEPDRYDESNVENWKPFNPGNSIASLLEEFKESKGYQFETEYLNGELAAEKLALIDENKKNSFCIVDLLSINSTNALVAQRFDTKELGGLFMPYCRNLHNDLKSLMDSIRMQYFKATEFYANSISYSFYAYDISVKQTFFQQLLHIFFDKFKIKNEIKVESSVRGLNISLL